jgi:methionyl-tRNA formyltransferase
MGTPDFAVPALRGLVQGGYEVVSVYTQPDGPSGRGQKVSPAPVKKEAVGFGLNVHQPATLKSTEEVGRLKDLRPLVIVVAAYAQILPQAVLAVPSRGCLNIHPSMLPRHRGPSPVAAAILAGDEVTGVSIMLMDKGMDTGPVLAQRQIRVLAWDTTGSLTVKLADLGAQLLMDTLPLWLEGKLEPQVQDSDKATYSKIIKKEDGRMDWARPAVELWRQVRAFQPWPGCYATWQGRLLKIIEAVPLPGRGEIGRVVEIPGQGSATVGVETGDGILGLVRVQLEGKRAVSADEFLRGQRGFVGSILSG